MRRSRGCAYRIPLLGVPVSRLALRFPTDPCLEVVTIHVNDEIVEVFSAYDGKERLTLLRRQGRRVEVSRSSRPSWTVVRF
jgi:hypothetical protein